MADVTIDPENKNAKELLNQGIRAYVLQDFTTAVQALGKASELLVTEHGDDLHDSLGDVYFYYGKALLALSRQESEPLGDAIPKGDNEEDDCEEDEENEETADNDVNEEKAKFNDSESQNGSSVQKIDDSTPSSSSENAKNTEISDENGEQKTENDEPTDLQLAWEVLELAKKIFEKRENEGKKQLAETLAALGEISLESENFEAAIVDIKDALAIQEEIFPNDSRKVAETCYNLGVAFSTNSQLDEAIQAFEKSLKYLNKRIENLEKDVGGEDEIKEIKELIPELMDKIADMKNYKEETFKKLAELAKQPEIVKKIAESGSSSKQVNDISHLVKRKRKAEDDCDVDKPSKKGPQ